MTQPPDDDPRLIALICELDERLASGQDSAELLAQASAALDRHQQAELHRAEQALDLIQRVRRNLSVLESLSQELAADESLPRTHESTQGPLKQKVADREAGLPRQLGRFEILDFLGQGGFNRVFLARDPQLNRLVALKVPKPGSLADSAASQRFRREAAAAAVLSHPSIVPVFESGQVGPISYIAFAYCPGQTLAQWFEGQHRHISPRVAAAVIAQLALAVEHAHQRGVVHRDLKPENVLIDGSSPGASAMAISEIHKYLRIADFGLARLHTTCDQTLTREGMVVGTPAYMSPEQARGDREINASADIFALGTILYELLTGDRPFKKQHYLATLRAIETEPPRPLRAGGRQLPRDLEAICLKCLQKLQQHRYATAFQLAADLQRWLDGIPVEARPVSRVERTWAWARRNPTLAAALSLALLSMAVGLSVSSLMWRRAAVNLRTAERNRQRAERNVERAQNTIDRMFHRLADDRTVPRSLRNHLIQDAVDLQQELLAEESGDAEVQLGTARAYRRLGQLYRDLGDTRRALDSIDRGWELIRGLPPEVAQADPRDIAFQLDYLKQIILADDGQRTSPENVANPQVAAASRDARSGRAKPIDRFSAIKLAMQQRTEALAMQRQGNLTGSIERFRDSLQTLASHSVSGKNRKVHGSIGLHGLAVALMHTGQLDEAEQCIEEACRLGIEASQEVTPRDDNLVQHAALCLCAAGDIYLRRAKHQLAVENFRRAQEIYRELLQDFPESMAANWGLLYAGTGTADAIAAQDPEDPECLVERQHMAAHCEQLTDQLLTSTFVGARAALTWRSLAAELRRADRLSEALDANRRAIAIASQRDEDPLKGTQLAICQADYAESLAQAGELEEAAEVAQCAVTQLGDLAAAQPDHVDLAAEFQQATATLARIRAQMANPVP